MDRRTVDLNGGDRAGLCAERPDRLTCRCWATCWCRSKGEGVFGLTYSAKGAFAAPKVNVNPLSLATPGILRRMFEGPRRRRRAAGRRRDANATRPAAGQTVVLALPAPARSSSCRRPA